MFKENDGMPSAKTLTSYRTGGFEVTALYGNPAQLPAGAATEICTCAYFQRDGGRGTGDGGWGGAAASVVR